MFFFYGDHTSISQITQGKLNTVSYLGTYVYKNQSNQVFASTCLWVVKNDFHIDGHSYINFDMKELEFFHGSRLATFRMQSLGHQRMFCSFASWILLLQQMIWRSFFQDLVRFWGMEAFCKILHPHLPRFAIGEVLLIFKGRIAIEAKWFHNRYRKRCHGWSSMKPVCSEH